ncbi:hypothetical protein FBU30_008377 [Linnemannia zychae]|nr:hypothetical protein FBU30_008377 [Linnemannia zychae]
MDGIINSDTGNGNEIGASTPSRNNNDDHNGPADPSGYAPFETPWSSISTPSLPSGISLPGDSIFRNMTSPAKGFIHSSESISVSLRLDEEEDTLHIEKSRILEQLRHASAEVDELENQLQAVRRRQARAALLIQERRQKAQESEAKDMRNVLGSIHQLTLSEKMKEAEDISKENTAKDNVPVKTLLNTLAAPGQAIINRTLVQRLESFTDISFTSIENHIISTTTSGNSERQYKITGSCFRLEFVVSFVVQEPTLDLVDLRITVPHSVRHELGQFIVSAEKHLMLLPFFRTFLQYAQMDYDRKRLMNSLAHRFPRLLKANHEFFKLSKSKAGSPSKRKLNNESSPEIVLQWTIEVNGQGRITPHLRLLPRMHKKWRQADEKGTLDAIPTQFARLMQIKGTEGAVAVLLQCIYGRKSTDYSGIRL